MQISAKTNYAIRALLLIAAADPRPITVTSMARDGLPVQFVRNILGECRRADLVHSRRGPTGGWVLARPADDITLGDILRVVDGPVSEVHGLAELRPSDVDAHLNATWKAVSHRVAALLDGITLAGVLAGDLPGTELAG